MKGYDTLQNSNAPSAPPPPYGPARFYPQQVPGSSYPMPQAIPLQTTIHVPTAVIPVQERPSRCWCCCCSCPFYICAIIVVLLILGAIIPASLTIK